LRDLLEVLHGVLVLLISIHPLADCEGGVLTAELGVDDILVSEKMAELLGQLTSESI